MTAVVADAPTPLTMNEMRPPEWREVSKLTLAAVPSAVGCARLLVQHALIGWQLDQHRATLIEEAVCVLVSHAVETTGVTEALPIYDEAFDHLTLIRVRLILESDRAIIEVWDSGSTQPEGSLGQHSVISRCDIWGYDMPARQRRVVWCVLSTVAGSDVEETIVLPQRMPRRTPRRERTKPAQAMRDPQILRRVLDGLRNLRADTEDGIGGQESQRPPGSG